ncbi:MAG TPA: metal-dependent hydrolase [Moraxellaceae bacterium]|nr:metal-dependent hydrolase [Moraxellaceae bacterium]
MGASRQNVVSIYNRLQAILPTRRDLKFKLPADKVGEWHYSGGPISTTFLNVFSVFLPVGERFFIDSVRAYRDQVTDPELKKAITAFIGQEAMHGREHEEYNEAVYAVWPAARKLEGFVKGLLDNVTRHLGKELSLSATIALEHFTALLADSVLRESKVVEGAEPHYKALWQWHALEETEHKAVAYDTWVAAMGTGPRAYALRATGMTLATIIFWGIMIPSFIEALRHERKLTDVKGWQQFYRFTFGEVGLLRMQLRDYFDYYRPGFHPWDHDNREFLMRIDAFLAEQEKLAA